MMRIAMSLVRRWLPAVPALALMAGCAGSGGWSTAESAARMFASQNLSAQQAQQAQSQLVRGQSTQADVLAALGPATVVKFDSGYEVWAYRSRAGRTRDAQRDMNAELVLLFSPAGVLEKSRVRPGLAAPKPVQ